MLELASSFWENFKNNIEPELVRNKIEAEYLEIAYQIPYEAKKVIKTEIDNNLINLFTDALGELKEIENKNSDTIESYKIKIKKEMLEKDTMIMELGNGLIAKLNKRGALTIK